MPYYREQFNFYHWLAVSLMLHACIIALPLVSFNIRAPHQPRHHKLAIELFGMIADRQQEERRGGNRVIPRMATQRTAAQQPVKKADRQRPLDTHKTTVTDSPVHEGKTDNKPNPTNEATGPTEASAASSPAVSGSPGAGADQRQLTIGHGGGHRSILGQYLAKVAKKVRANIVYPEGMRKKGVEGVSWITFIITQSGEIRESSLRVARSSGYATFDSGALKSARVSAPFEKPPKELLVNIAVSFDVETAQSRTKRVSLQ